MTDHFAFIGDVHGNLLALQGMYEALSFTPEIHLVFLGDYINKGKNSRRVLEELLIYRTQGRSTFLAGNHEDALVECFDNNDLALFLKMGGASTIRSYLPEGVSSDVMNDFRIAMPQDHIEFVRSMPRRFETEDLIAQHTPLKEESNKFSINAHINIGCTPVINDFSASVDTGSGSTTNGRLTALLWPSRSFIQVDVDGKVI